MYDFLRQSDENRIELTLAEIKERLNLPIGAEGVRVREAAREHGCVGKT